MTHALLTRLREEFHALLCDKLLVVDDKGFPSNSDKNNKVSVCIAKHMLERMGQGNSSARLVAQTSGNLFEECCMEFIERSFRALERLKPGSWTVARHGLSARDRLAIAKYGQYSHLGALAELAKHNPALKAAIGSDYLITPDLVVELLPWPDGAINHSVQIVDQHSARNTMARGANSDLPLLHASISCKWTLRSDRAQNARSEALNLVKNRKGRVPHIMIVTGEPLPSRIASLALGTGEVDCVYHMALYELLQAVKDLDYADAGDLLEIMIEGKRLRDISDLPFDLLL